ncbi:MAG: hypothetical protein HY721_22685 [Planctomycetes bacterium]|nr:hypothetical protein [Planctomycetota bacterium]
MELYDSWRDSPQVPPDWEPAAPPGAVVKVRLRNLRLLRALRQVLPGSWVKVYRRGRDGSEMHYFQHASGAVFNVKHKVKQ